MSEVHRVADEAEAAALVRELAELRALLVEEQHARHAAANRAIAAEAELAQRNAEVFALAVSNAAVSRLFIAHLEAIARDP